MKRARFATIADRPIEDVPVRRWSGRPATVHAAARQLVAARRSSLAFGATGAAGDHHHGQRGELDAARAGSTVSTT